jgi:D-alanyl-D-alanine-carboxypeptidase/D-alanyl-D-alanine-endopeptidase
MRVGRRWRAAGVAGLLLGIAGCNSPSPLEQKVDQQISPLVSSTVPPDHRYVGVSVAVVTPRTVHFFNFGETSLGSGQAPTPTTIFEVASITKLFTSLVLAKEVVRGRIGLTDPISICAPSATSSTCFRGEPVCYVHLASHMSGLPRLPTNLHPADYGNPYADYTDADLRAFLASYSLTREPGTVFEYSNLAVGWLGQLLSQGAGLDYESLVRNEITSELGLEDTRITLSGEQEVRFAPTYAAGIPAEHWDFQALAGTGALRSTAADLARFLQAEMGLRSTSLSAAMELSQVPRFGSNPLDSRQEVALSWQIDGTNSMIWKDGATYGSRSFVGFDKAEKVGVVVLSNTALSTGTDLDNAISNAAVQILHYAVSMGEQSFWGRRQGALPESGPTELWRPPPGLE